MKLSAEDRKLVARMKEIRELISEFGLTLSGYDPGITAMLKERPALRGDGWGGEAITFDDPEWKWLEPLLKELRFLRMTAKPADPERLVEWLTAKKRKPANTAFTEGPERQAAYWMEAAMEMARKERRGKGGK